MILQEVKLPKSKYGVGVSWDRGRRTVDIDLQGVVVDQKGTIIDAVYYNNLKALKAIWHSGDETTGDKSGLDEVIWVNLTGLPEHVQLIIFIVAVYSGGSLRDASGGTLHILEERKTCELARFDLEDSVFKVDVVALIQRSPSGWSLRIVDEPAEEGRHFMDILEPTLGKMIRSLIPGAPARQKIAFAMEKGAVMDLPGTSSLGLIKAGLGWDISPNVGREVDLDVSAVFFSKDGHTLGAVFFGNTEEFGLRHSGDNLTGEGDGDDEVITANLESVPLDVEQIFFVVNIYTNGVCFDQVCNSYCRIFDGTETELARYVLAEGRGNRGLIISRLFREPGDRWGFQALGQFCRGKTWKDAVQDMLPLFKMGARELQGRRPSGFLDVASKHQELDCGDACAVVAQPPPNRKSSACTIS